MLHAHLATLAFAASALAASGCGGSAKPSSQSASKFHTRANAICQRLNTGIAAAIQSIPTSHTHRNINRAEIAQVTHQRAVVEQAALLELSKLTPPVPMARDWQQIVVIRQTVTKAMANLGEDAEFHNLPGEHSVLMSIAGEQKQLSTITTRDGLTPCSQIK